MKVVHNQDSTPVMRQYWDVKHKHQNAIILFRMGDFYETFEDDAKKTAKILGIALTKRANGAASSVPLAGFPFHALDQHLHKLLQAGHRVAICEQVENPKESKGIVKREVVEVISPGTAISDKFLHSSKNNYLCSLFFKQSGVGVSLLDHSTGKFISNEIDIIDLNNIFSHYDISEILILDGQKELLNKYLDISGLLCTTLPNWLGELKYTNEILCDHFSVASLKGFGFHNLESAIISSGFTLHYVKENYYGRIKHLTSLKLLKNSGIMRLDKSTIKNLELFTRFDENNKQGTLLSIIDKTITFSGSRLLKDWLIRPLYDRSKIVERQLCVNELFDNENLINDIRSLLKEVVDIERTISKISNNKANPQDIINLSNSLAVLGKISQLKISKASKLYKLLEKEINISEIIKSIKTIIKSQPAVNLQKGGYVNSGVSKELDDIRNFSEDANQWLMNYQKDLVDATKISNLKINYNRVFGYYIEVTKSHIEKVPDSFIRKQTLVNSERYFTEELKEYEVKILSAETKIVEIENEIFNNLCNNIIDHANAIQINSNIISVFDIYSSFAFIALKYNYVKPDIIDGYTLEIESGRHPVIERLLEESNDFIPNNVSLNRTKNLAVITGPNMSGKSTYLRQTGIIIIMAQIGMYVPAKNAKIGMIDQLFTRVGASDNLVLGESTFLVEMQETANIINNATERSFILLDEIGRGTSTYDGLSLAWSISEYIHDSIAAKTLFATHYHELVDLAEQLEQGFNLSIAVEESENGKDVVFLRKIIKGGTDKSYGIHVAKMAGLPDAIISKANIYLELLVQKKGTISKIDRIKIDTFLQRLSNDSTVSQYNIYDELKKIDINKITPIEAINLLSDIIKKYEK